VAEHLVYRHIWEIVDDTLPLSALRLEANRELGALLNQRGVVATDRPRYTVAEDRLVVEVPVDRVAPDVDEEAVLRRLHAGKHPGHIAAELGLPRSVVEAIEAADQPAEVAG